MEPRIYSVIRLMLSELDRERPLEELAQSVNLSPSRLRHLFKSETGVSPAQYLKAHKLEKARLLLENTFLTLKEIMHQAGFTDRSHFMRDFQKTYGLPPLQYRKQFLLAQQKPQAVVRTAIS
ncbi:MAG: helix-turn-helix domain-containing protein [Acidobacteria bacterium]|nr:helix-turn-helix domain-containing protein [Acidobacteriota bacterium]